MNLMIDILPVSMFLYITPVLPIIFPHQIIVAVK